MWKSLISYAVVMSYTETNGNVRQGSPAPIPSNLAYCAADNSSYTEASVAARPPILLNIGLRPGRTQSWKLEGITKPGAALGRC